ncbi:MAG: class I SAM-dependent methyltransferase, partial [Phycisphaerae bacterium]
MNGQAIAAKLIPVVFEDADYLFVAKPAGFFLPKSAGSAPARRGGGSELGALFSGQPLLVVAPLDAHLSGVVPLAKSPEAAQTLAKALEKARACCDYTAVIAGKPETARAAGSTGWKPVPQRHGKSPAIAPQVIRRRGHHHLIGFTYGPARSSALRAALQASKLSLLGEPRRRPDRPSTRPRGRLFLHRGKIQFRHPRTRQPVTVHAPLPPAFNAALTRSDRLEDTLEVALAARIPCLVDERTDAFRLITGQVEGLPGLVAEKLGPVVILQTHQGKFQGDLDTLRRVANWYRRTLGSTAVYHKRFTKSRGSAGDPADAQHELRDPVPFAGDRVPDEIPIREHGLTFLVRPYDGHSVGLFLDQRDNRRKLAELARGQRVLNVFAYTCGFSIAAAAHGARATVSVDISVKALEWGKRNFAANG